MAIGDIVAIRLATTSPTTFQAQPPHYGIISAEAAGPPLTRTVLWDVPLSSQLVADALADFGLDVIEDADQATVDELMGQFARRIAPGGATSTDPAGGTSYEFSGRIVAVYRRTPIEALPGSGDEYAVMQVSPDLFFEDRATQFAVVA